MHVFAVGFVNTFLSWDAFSPLSKVTYVAFLAHFSVIIAYITLVRFQMQFNNFFMVRLFKLKRCVDFSGSRDDAKSQSE